MHVIYIVFLLLKHIQHDTYFTKLRNTRFAAKASEKFYYVINIFIYYCVKLIVKHMYIYICGLQYFSFNVRNIILYKEVEVHSFLLIDQILKFNINLHINKVNENYRKDNMKNLIRIYSIAGNNSSLD